MKNWCLVLLLVVGSFAWAQAPASAPSKNQQSSTNQQAPTSDSLAGSSSVVPEVSTNPKPLSVAGKFKLFAVSSISPGRLAGACLGAGFGQAIDSPSGYSQGGEGYAKRFGASMATGASKNLFGDFIIPAALHHDPRLVIEHGWTLNQSLKYAMRRTIIARTDDAHEAFNWEGILAPIAAQSIANSYLPDHERTVGKTFQRSAVMIGSSVATNLLKAAWPTISNRIRKGSRP